MDIESITDADGSPGCGYYAKGHHNPAEFVRQIEELYGDRFSVSKVRQEYARKVPIRNADVDWILTPGQRGRGAFQVTWIEVGTRRENS